MPSLFPSGLREIQITPGLIMIPTMELTIFWFLKLVELTVALMTMTTLKSGQRVVKSRFILIRAMVRKTRTLLM